MNTFGLFNLLKIKLEKLSDEKKYCEILATINLNCENAPSNYLNELFRHFSYKKDIIMMDILLDLGADINYDVNIFPYCIASGNISDINFLVKKIWHNPSNVSSISKNCIINKNFYIDKNIECSDSDSESSDSENIKIENSKSDIIKYNFSMDYIENIMNNVNEILPNVLKCAYYEDHNFIFHLVIVNKKIYNFIDFKSKIDIEKINYIFTTNHKYLCYNINSENLDIMYILNEICLFVSNNEKFSFLGFKEINMPHKNMEQPKLYGFLKNSTDLQENEANKICKIYNYFPILYKDENYNIDFLENFFEIIKDKDIIYVYDIDLLDFNFVTLSHFSLKMLEKNIGFISSNKYTSNEFFENTKKFYKFVQSKIASKYSFRPLGNQKEMYKAPYGKKIVDGKYVIDDDENVIIDMIRKYIEEDKYTLCKIVSILNENRIPTKNKKIWYVSTLKSIIEKNNIKINKK